MRPPKKKQNELLRPLNTILGTEASVRLLRELALSTTSLTAGELAKRAELGRTSVYPALQELERAEVVELVGAGTRRQVQLRLRHPLSRALKELFRAESLRFEELVAELRGLFVRLPHRPLSAWAEERTSDGRIEDTLHIYFVSAPDEIEASTDSLNERLTAIERASDVNVAIRGLTRSELEAAYATRARLLTDAVLLDGVPPAALLKSARTATAKRAIRTHDDHDARAKRLALAVATKIRRDPGLIRLAEERVRRRSQKAGASEKRELAEWMRILSTMSPVRLQRFLLEDSERATRLRQSLPTLNLLSATERDAVIRSETDAEVRAAVRPR